MNKLLFLLVLLLSACSPKPKPIEYGSDACDYCRMTVVDQQHAAELVSSKGKAYKFDAIECMVHYKREHDDREYALLLVNDYLQKGELVPAEECTFLISPNIQAQWELFCLHLKKRKQP